MKFTNRHHLPDYLVSYLQRFYKPEPYRIGVTSLIDEPLQRILLMKHWDELVVDVMDFFNTIKGHGTHSLFQDKLPKIEIEQNGFTIVGEADKIFNDNLIDIKVTSVWTLIYKSRLEDYAKQLNCYDWLNVKKYNRPFSKLFIDMFLDDWKVSKTKQRGNSDYPETPFKRIEIPKWSFEQQEQFVKQQLEKHKLALDNPQECSPEGKWQRSETFAVMKKGNKRAIRVFETKKEAENYHKSKDNYIEIRKGECVRCDSYCILNQVCPYYKGNKKEK